MQKIENHAGLVQFHDRTKNIVCSPISHVENPKLWTTLAVQWSRLWAPFANQSTGSIPGQETKIPHAMQHSQRENPDLITDFAL